MNEERMQILEMISNGTISVDEASQLLAALEEGDESSPEEHDVDPEKAERDAHRRVFFEFTPNERKQAPGEALESDVADAGPMGGEDEESEPLPPIDAVPMDFPEPPLGFKKWQSFWLIPLTAGILITVVSGLLLYAGTQAEWNGFWMFCIWLPLLFGIAVLLFGAMSRTARWLHVRVNTGQDEWPRRVAISFPLPLRTSAWVMRIFGHYIPGLDDIPVPIHEAIQALQESLTPDEPLYIKVDDSGGEKVEVYIG